MRSCLEVGLIHSGKLPVGLINKINYMRAQDSQNTRQYQYHILHLKVPSIAVFVQDILKAYRDQRILKSDAIPKVSGKLVITSHDLRRYDFGSIK